MSVYSEQLIIEVLDQLKFDGAGLIPAVVQQYDSGEVLMLAWMNREAVTTTLRSREVHFWSRSRQELWRKGESSGHTQRLVEFRFDCDQDAVLLLVEQNGPACHTLRPSCFYLAVSDDRIVTIAEPLPEA